MYRLQPTIAYLDAIEGYAFGAKGMTAQADEFRAGGAAAMRAST